MIVNVNAPAEQAPAMAPPTRTDDQILPRSRWVPESSEAPSPAKRPKAGKSSKEVKDKELLTAIDELGHDESSLLYAELGLTDSETESDEEVPGTDAGDQDEGQARPNLTSTSSTTQLKPITSSLNGCRSNSSASGPSGTLGASGASGSSQLPPPPPPPSTNQSDHKYLSPHVTSIPENIHMDAVRLPDEQASALASTYAPPRENSLLSQTGDMAIFMDWFCKKQGITELTQKDLEGPAFEIVKVFHPNVIRLQYQMEECYKLITDQVDDAIIRHNVNKPLPLGGQPGQVTIQADFFFNKDLEYLRYGSKGGRPALSISKMKAAYYLDVGLEQMVPDQIHTSEGDCRAVRTHMRILSVVRNEVFSLYRYDYMKTIVLCRADLNEYIIAERDFKYLYPSDFEDLYLLNLQGHLNHLPPQDKKILSTIVNLWIRNLVIRQRVEDFQLGIKSYQTLLNLTKPQWDASGFEFKHDFTVIDSPRAVTFRDQNHMVYC
ncbi:hypothetical protein Tco_0843528 [Tanacetum coccineum]|uniref:Uncharacterized protein n=1 Tax=Tanacetum coccineum TaxID=301880 RepID=A0ABQ5B2E0_9ASTR